MRSLRLLLSLLCLALALPSAAGFPAPEKGKLTIYFFDIGQGDAFLIVSPTGKTVLVDGGPPDGVAHLVERVRSLVKGQLDLVILSHPHLDHLAGLPDVIQTVGTRRYMDPGFDHTSKSYNDLVAVVNREVSTGVTLPTPDPKKPAELVQIGLGGDAVLTILWPRRPVDEFLRDTRSDANSNSVVAKLTYGKTAFFLTGDAEPDTEAYLIQQNIDFTSTVLKTGHHGGRHSSTAEFLDKVKPKAAIISCALGNDYGHPGPATLERLAAVNAAVFRTDQDGEILAVSDGNTVVITPQNRPAQKGTFVGETTRGSKVATGPIEPAERKVSKATLEDRERYGKTVDDSASSDHKGGHGHAATKPAAHGGGAPSDLGGTVKSAVASKEPPPPAKVEKPIEDLIPASVKERYATTEGEPESTVRYIADKKTRSFHMSDCLGAKGARGSNRVTFTSRSAAAKKFAPAGDCNP